MNFFSYTVSTIIGLIISSVGMYLAYASAPEYFLAMLGLLSLIYIAVIGFIAKKNADGEEKNYSILLIMPFFLFVGLGQLFSFVGSGFGLLSANSTAFEEACKDVGPTYFKQPSAAVHSIAFDWDGEHEPEYNHFKVLFGTRVTNLGYSALPTQNDIEFKENKRGRRDSWATHGVTPISPYLRYSKKETKNIDSLTADILVRYKLIPIEGVTKSSVDKPVKYEIRVIDRRTNENLSSFRYVVDEKKSRACGLTSNGEMNETEFISKSIGKKL